MYERRTTPLRSSARRLAPSSLNAMETGCNTSHAVPPGRSTRAISASASGMCIHGSATREITISKYDDRNGRDSPRAPTNCTRGVRRAPRRSASTSRSMPQANVPGRSSDAISVWPAPHPTSRTRRHVAGMTGITRRGSSGDLAMSSSIKWYACESATRASITVVGSFSVEDNVVLGEADRLHPVVDGEAGEAATRAQRPHDRRTGEVSRRIEQRDDPQRQAGHGRIDEDGCRTPLTVVRGDPTPDRRVLPDEHTGVERHARERPDEQCAPPAPERADPRSRLQRYLDLRELKSQLHAVRCRAREVVDDDPVPGLHEHDAAAMTDRIRELAIAVVLRIRVIEPLGRDPAP